MCGIYGSTFIQDDKIIKAKLSCMGTRGPDYSSYVTLNNIQLGHNRLAIIDLDPRSNQPFNYKGNTIVFNGEVYNFQEIKERLCTRGYQFETDSDTEVIAAAYLEFGEACVEHFNGMFAFVIYDRSREVLFGSRDRLGKKPFYYYLQGKEFEFASQLSVITLGRKLEIDDEALVKYLYWNYIPEPYTPFKDVFKLPSAHSFTFNLNTNDFLIWKYWDLPERENVAINNYEIATDQLDDLLSDAVSLRMISDVSLGVFLSGGVDSSLVAALAQKSSPVPVKTFSIKFNELGFDESKYAQEVARLLGTNHTEIECSYEEGINFIKDFANFYDEPFADSSAIPTLLLSKYTKQRVTVALSGDGGDETFMGYNIYDIVHQRRKVFKIPYSVRFVMSTFIRFFMHKSIRLNLISEGLLLRNIRDFYVSYFKGLNRKWITRDEREIDYVKYLYNPNKSLMESISDFDTKKYMNGDCITKVERASMAFSLEVRSPLMDYRIVEFARQVPTDFKFQEGNKKRILKDVLYRYLPRELFERRKSGFGMPLGIWFRTILRDYVNETLDDANLELVNNWVVKEEFFKILEEHMSGLWDHTPKIWKVIVLINWLKKNENVIVKSV